MTDDDARAEQGLFGPLDSIHEQLPATQATLAHLVKIAFMRKDLEATVFLLEALLFVMNEQYGERA